MGQGQGVVRDVSAASIYFITDVSLKAGQSFVFTLLFQNASPGPISAHCMARVVRLEKQGCQSGVAASISNIAFHLGAKFAPCFSIPLMPHAKT
jgi:hypothetical protein